MCEYAIIQELMNEMFWYIGGTFMAGAIQNLSINQGEIMNTNISGDNSRVGYV